MRQIANNDNEDASAISEGVSMLTLTVIAALAAAALLLVPLRPRARRVETKRWHRELDALRSATDAAGGEHRWPGDDAPGGHVRMVSSGGSADQASGRA